MSKLFTKTLSVILVAAMLFSCVIVNAVTPEETELVPSDEAYQYLWDQGFPPEVVETLSAESIMEIYNEQYELESVSTTYGIFTESDSISYEIDESGNIIMDDNNRSQFNDLLQDNAKTQKILHDKVSAMTREEAAALVSAEPSSNMNAVKPIDAVIQSLTNWSAYILVLNMSSTYNFIKKQIIYSWNWNYDPFFTLIDKAGMAWSKSFTAETSSIKWNYRAWNTDAGKSKSWSDTGYDAYTTDCGFGQSYDIVNSITIGTTDYDTNRHSGSLQGNISKYLIGAEQNVQNQASVVGRYYHKQPGTSGGLYFGAAPSIFITFEDYYDASPDSAQNFYFYPLT